MCISAKPHLRMNARLAANTASVSPAESIKIFGHSDESTHGSGLSVSAVSAEKDAALGRLVRHRYGCTPEVVVNLLDHVADGSSLSNLG